MLGIENIPLYSEEIELAVPCEPSQCSSSSASLSVHVLIKASPGLLMQIIFECLTEKSPAIVGKSMMKLVALAYPLDLTSKNKPGMTLYGQSFFVICHYPTVYKLVSLSLLPSANIKSIDSLTVLKEFTVTNIL